MEAIGIVVIVMAAVASLTKLIDVVTTTRNAKREARFMGANRAISLEMNPIGRAIFRRFGVVGGCWVTFAIWTRLHVLSAGSTAGLAASWVFIRRKACTR